MSILGVIHGVSLWADINAATPPGSRGRSALCAAALPTARLRAWTTATSPARAGLGWKVAAPPLRARAGPGQHQHPQAAFQRSEATPTERRWPGRRTHTRRPTTAHRRAKARAKARARGYTLGPASRATVSDLGDMRLGRNLACRCTMPPCYPSPTRERGTPTRVGCVLSGRHQGSGTEARGKITSVRVVSCFLAFLLSSTRPHARCTPLGRTCRRAHEIDLTPMQWLLNGCA